MQRTRLDTLVNTQVLKFQLFFDNPWRTISLVIISLLLGFFFGVAVISTVELGTSGDPSTALILVIGIEILNNWFYAQKKRSLWMIFLNGLKIGFIYSFFLQALMVGS